MKLLIINGPNLNLLGSRQPEIYGNSSFETYLAALKKRYADTEILYYQSNIEGEIIDKLQYAEKHYNGIILNAGGYSHTSVAIADTVAAIKTPVIEVHISNIYARELYRQNSYVSKHAVGAISGFGLDSYELALLYFKLKKEN